MKTCGISILLIRFLTLLISLHSWAAKGENLQMQNSTKCESTPTLKAQTIELLQIDCVLRRDSAQCRNLYAEVDKEESWRADASSMKLKCDKKDLEYKRSFAYVGDWLLACGSGFVVDPLKDLVGLAFVPFDQMLDNKICNGDLQMKKQLLTALNLDAPSSMQMTNLNDAELKQMTCSQIKAHLYNHNNDVYIAARNKKLRKQTLNVTELEVLDYVEKPKPANSKALELSKMVDAIMDKMKVKRQCFSPQHLTRLRCEIASFVVTSIAAPGLVGLRSAKLAKLSGMKVDDFVQAVNSAERSAGGISGKFASKIDQTDVLLKAGALSKAERVAATEKLLGKKLLPEQADRLWEMHQVGSKEGRGFFSLTKEDVDKKLQLAMAINPKSVDGKQPYFTMDEIKVLMRNGVTGITGKEQDRIKGEKLLADGFVRSSKEKLDEGFAVSNAYYREYLDLDSQKFASAIGQAGIQGNPRAGDFFVRALTGGLKPEDSVKLADKIATGAGGKKS